MSEEKQSASTAVQIIGGVHVSYYRSAYLLLIEALEAQSRRESIKSEIERIRTKLQGMSKEVQDTVFIITGKAYKIDDLLSGWNNANFAKPLGTAINAEDVHLK